MDKSLLEIKNLHVQYITEEDTYNAVNGIDFHLGYGETLGIVGETGAGKTTTALSIMQLIPDPPGLIVSGEILFKGKNIVFNTEKENRAMRGNGISMIFQDPMTALNPVMTIGKQLTEVIINHKKISKAQAYEEAVQLLETVGVKRDRFHDYPHQFSGGMKQRVVIAMALLCKPEILIADEPTTALDVTIQAQVLQMIKDLSTQYNMSMLLITHDLGVVAETCNRVLIMYAGQIMESGTVMDVYNDPLHPYTVGLFGALPNLEVESDRLVSIEGVIPNSASLPSGCPFHTRCKHIMDICARQAPQAKGDGHVFKCHLPIDWNRK